MAPIKNKKRRALMNENKKYVIRTFLVLLFLVPLLLSSLSALIIFLDAFGIIITILIFIVLLTAGYFYTKKTVIPEDIYIRYLPMLMSIMYTSIFWVIAMFVSKGDTKSDLFWIFWIWKAKTSLM